MNRKLYHIAAILVAYATVIVQLLLPHHHHDQVILPFFEACPVDGHKWDSHTDEEDCDHAHSEHTECSELNHLVALHKKQDVFSGGLDWNIPPALPALLAFNLLEPTISDTPTVIPDLPFLYRSIVPDGHALRGPPAHI